MVKSSWRAEEDEITFKAIEKYRYGLRITHIQLALENQWRRWTLIFECIMFRYSCLRELNLEGNQLGAMPVGALYLNIKYLRISNNFTHPLLWRETATNQPQVRRIATMT